MPRLYWFWPERDRPESVREDEEAWDNYRRAAAAAGLRLELIAVDDVDIVADPVGPRAYVKGELADPRQVFFHNKLYTWPMFQPDVWRSLALFQGLAGAGYHLLVRPELNLISNDKAATLLHLRDVDAGWLRTVSVPTREFRQLRFQLSEAGIGYPVVVKPASWGSGKGVIRADDERALLMALRLASASELTMVLQPFLAPAGELADVRVYCVDREPAAALRRTVRSGGTVANVTSGGSAELAAVPPELRERAAAIAARLDAPWLAVDFLFDGRAYYLSEVEIDAYVGPVTGRLPGMADIMAARFRAYRARFDRWLPDAVPAPVSLPRRLPGSGLADRLSTGRRVAGRRAGGRGPAGRRPAGTGVAGGRAAGWRARGRGAVNTGAANTGAAGGRAAGWWPGGRRPVDTGVAGPEAAGRRVGG